MTKDRLTHPVGPVERCLSLLKIGTKKPITLQGTTVKRFRRWENSGMEDSAMALRTGFDDK
jgi:hypothetical protein